MGLAWDATHYAILGSFWSLKFCMIGNYRRYITECIWYFSKTIERVLDRFRFHYQIFYRSRFHFIGYRRRFRLRRKIGDFSKTISDNRELPFSFSALIHIIPT